MRCKVFLATSAVRDMRRLSSEAARRVSAAIDALGEDARPADAVKLAAQEDLYRVRVGVYRIVYQVQDDPATVLVLRVKHRREAYRHL